MVVCPTFAKRFVGSMLFVYMLLRVAVLCKVYFVFPCHKISVSFHPLRWIPDFLFECNGRAVLPAFGFSHIPFPTSHSVVRYASHPTGFPISAQRLTGSWKAFHPVSNSQADKYIPGTPRPASRPV